MAKKSKVRFFFLCRADISPKPQVKLLVSSISVSASTNGSLNISSPEGPPKVLPRRTAKVANRLANNTQSVIRYTQKPKRFLSSDSGLAASSWLMRNAPWLQFQSSGLHQRSVYIRYPLQKTE